MFFEKNFLLFFERCGLKLRSLKQFSTPLRRGYEGQAGSNNINTSNYTLAGFMKNQRVFEDNHDFLFNRLLGDLR